MIDFNQIDKGWTLYLDRDGVINHEKYADYINTWGEFTFYEGALEAIRLLSQKFNRIIVVTNQRGVGRGVTKPEDLEKIHRNMVAHIEKAKGRIDAVYFCPDLDDTSPDRKPNPGMGLKAAKDFPDIDLKKALIVGNNLSDMEFGRNLGIYTVFLNTTETGIDYTDYRIDAFYDSLISLARDLVVNLK